METLVFQTCVGFTDDDLANIQRLPNLEYLDIVTCAPVSDAGLAHPSKLKNLETLCLRKSTGQITDVGLQSLQDLAKLKQIYVNAGDFTPNQITTMKRLLSNVAIQGN